MSARETILQLRCPDCRWSELCDLLGMRAWLHSVGMLRRATDPEAEMIVELFRKSREKFECPECDAELRIEQPADEDWPAAQSCQACGKTIPPARIAAIPGATMCAACQEKADRGESLGEAEYCEHCGGILVMKQSGSGITRYTMRCSDCGR